MATRGIDVSSFQDMDKANFNSMVGEVDFVIARATYGTSRDRSFVEHINWSRERYFRVGAYHFFRQTQDYQAQLDAFCKAMDAARIGVGDIIPWVDTEWNEEYDGEVVPEKYMEGSTTILSGLIDRYGDGGVYLAPGFYEILQKSKEVPASELLAYPWWVSHYTSKDEPWCPWKAWTMWQKSGSMRVGWYAKASANLDYNVVNTDVLLPDIRSDVA